MWRIGVAAALVAATVAGTVGVVAVPGPASGAEGAEPPAAELWVVNDATNVADPLDVPTIVPGSTGPGRGLDLVVVPGGAFAAPDEVRIAVDDADGGDVGFAAVPTVTVGGAARGAVRLDEGGRVLVVGVGAAGAGATRLRVRNIRYAVAPSATRGPVRVVANYRGQQVTPVATEGATMATNAYVSDVIVARATPAVAAATGPPGSTAPLAPLSVAEARPGALGAPGSLRGICVRRTDGGPFVGPGAVTVQAGSATLQAPPAVVAGTEVRFTLALGPALAPVRVALADLTVPGDAPALVALQVAPCEGGVPLGPEVRVGALTRTRRIAGSSRYATAARVAESLAGDTGAPVAVMARGDDFADAVAASYLAAVVGDGRPAPLLLTPPDGVPQLVLGALRRMGTKRVVLVGGPFAISPEVSALLDATPAYEAGGVLPALQCDAAERVGGACTLAVERVSGLDRYATAAAIASMGRGPGGLDLTPGDGIDAPRPTAFLARGDEVADALAVGPLVGAGAPAPAGDGAPVPLLLTPPTELSAVTFFTLRALGVEQVVVIGGPKAVSDAVVRTLRGAGLAVVRIAGIDRQETAGKLATLAITPPERGGLGFPTGIAAGRGELVLARGDDFADALAFGPWCAARRAPLMLAAGPAVLGAAARAFLDATSSAFAGLVVAGGPAAMGDSVVAEALAAKTGAVVP